MAFLETVTPFFTEKGNFRDRFWQCFQEKGIPEYSYLPLSQLRNLKITQPSPLTPLQKSEEMPEALVLVDGILQKELSCPTSEKIVVMPLTSALKEYAAVLKPHFDRVASEEKDGFALMGPALIEDGLFLYIPPKVSTALTIINIQTSASAFSHIEIFLGKRASCRIALKNYTQNPQSVFGHEYLHMHLAEEAKLHLDKIDSFQSKQWAFSFTRAVQKSKSELQIALATTGAFSSRHDFKTTLLEEKASCHIGAITKLKNFRQAHHSVLIEHCAEETESKQLFKTILDDVSRASFQGEIFVDRLAQKTAAFQLNKSLILSDKAISYSRPQLQIFADDVKASHGATVGEIDPEMLFYLQSRGLSQETARTMLVNSFAEEVLSWFDPLFSQIEARRLLA